MKRLIKKLYRKINPYDPVGDAVKRGLVVGKNFKMLFDVILDHSHTHHITIGDDVTIAPKVHILAHDASTKTYLQYTRVGKVKIGSRVFVGANSVILPGVTIGDDVIIGAGSVVSRSIPDGTVVAGNPAKPICSTKSFLARKKLEMAATVMFESEYTVERGVTKSMLDEMSSQMVDGVCYLF